MEHTIKFCSLSEYKRWVNGEVVYHPETKTFIPRQDVKDELIFKKDDYCHLYSNSDGDFDFYKIQKRQREYRESHPYYNQDAYITYGTTDDRLDYFINCSIIDGVEVVAFGEF